jgi:hypothetical protein
LVSATTGSQFAMMAALESRALCRRGIIMGTAITRAIWQAKKATMNSRPGGNTSSARSPGRATDASSRANARALS